ncbi:hypothetical protein L2E82_33164 [Cichorium intybus]|uniref:Uncharacterized protein n=1 Tax=Cichorium intybus TaxID=13427 RepID=A0ACB9BJE9_CICIN|nr:hypothetical protein L2E82_33164 [Cichorium intybus]
MLVNLLRVSFSVTASRCLLASCRTMATASLHLPLPITSPLLASIPGDSFQKSNEICINTTLDPRLEDSVNYLEPGTGLRENQDAEAMQYQ